MTKILLHFPAWNNRWIPYITDELSRYDLTVTHSENVHEVVKLSKEADILMSMWANDVVEFWSKNFSFKKIITWLRRYEIHTTQIRNGGILFNRVDALIFVSWFYRSFFNQLMEESGFPKPKAQHVIPNGIDVSHFDLRVARPKTYKIALVCSLKEVKNIPLAFQILLNLPEKYTLHHIGLPFKDLSARQLFGYMENLGISNRFVTNGFVEPDKVAEWLADKDFIISTSLNEGNPNCIIEAMAMGIKPVIHNWPGAREQFPKHLVFNTVDEAVGLLTEERYMPELYRSWIEERYSLDNFKKIHQVIDEALT